LPPAPSLEPQAVECVGGPTPAYEKRRLDSRAGRAYIPVGMVPSKKREPVPTRQSLLRAAFEAIHGSGFRGADVETILQVAGVTKGALYHHFDGKDALGYAVVDEVIARIMRERWLVPLRVSADPIDELIAIVRSTPHKSEHVRRGCPLNNISQEMSSLDEEFRKRTARIFTDWREGIAGALRRGQSLGTLRRDVDPDETAAFVIATYEGYLSLAKNSQEPKQLMAGMEVLARYFDSLRANRRRVRKP
jgi:TetR/AcrR family transcriptional regulator, transcriptional repressor for nem operon